MENFLKKSINTTEVKNITPIAEECIRRLQEATPKNSGLTAKSWKYEIKQLKNKKILEISNTNILNGVNIAFLLDIGHATGNGVWIEGKHFIEPIVRDAYNQILNNTWKELKRL